MRTTQATNLYEVFETLSPEPLQTPAELDAFYGDDLNKVRGSDRIAAMVIGLKLHHGKKFYKTFLMGHSGVGKSTELSRLIYNGDITPLYRAIRFDVESDLDYANFKPFDILLLMMIKVVEETSKPIDEGGTGEPPPESLLQAIWSWFATEKSTVSLASEVGAEAAAGLNVPASSLWAKVLGLFANLKGEAKISFGRKKEMVDYRLSRIFELLDLVNRLLDECYARLRGTGGGREWLFIGEGFDKPHIPVRLTEDLFVNYGNIFRGLHAHMVFNVPISLVYSDKGPRLPTLSGGPEIITDTPVYLPDRSEHRAGREAVRRILELRAAPALFGRGQMMRLIVASGGNIRDLFILTLRATTEALLRDEVPDARIRVADVTRSIDEMRSIYAGRLGEGPHDEEKMSYEEKAKCLLSIYHGDKVAEISTPELNSLIRARAVLQFNGRRWFGVHPLVVDILADQGKIKKDEKGRVHGGTH